MEELETRQRLLEAAAKLFAERGFNNTSVREICQQAGANVGAMNYHFRDKLGLYRDVVQMVAHAMDDVKQSAMDVGQGGSPEEQVRAYIRDFLHHLLDENEDCWMDMLIGREMADPSPALDLIIERGIKPSAARLCGMVSQILDCPPAMLACGSALSVSRRYTFFTNSRSRSSPDGDRVSSLRRRSLRGWLSISLIFRWGDPRHRRKQGGGQKRMKCAHKNLTRDSHMRGMRRMYRAASGAFAFRRNRNNRANP